MYDIYRHQSNLTTNRANVFRLHSDSGEENHVTIHDLRNAHSILTGSHVPQDQTITFTTTGTEILRLGADGDIYVRGRLATNDLEVVDAMRQFLSGQGLL